MVHLNMQMKLLVCNFNYKFGKNLLKNMWKLFFKEKQEKIVFLKVKQNSFCLFKAKTKLYKSF